MTTLIISLALFTLLIGCSETKPEDLPQLPTMISSLPIGIVVEPVGSEVASPQVVSFVEGLSSNLTNYEWSHAVTIQVDKPTQIIEFGVYAWIDDEWVDANAGLPPFTATDFSNWFDCEDATLLPGLKYESDRFSNYRNVSLETKQFLRWYFIGENEDGKCRGEITLIDLPTP